MPPRARRRRRRGILLRTVAALHLHLLLLPALAACGGGDAAPEPEAAEAARTDEVVLTPDQRARAGIRTDTARMSQVATWHAFPAVLAPPDTATAEVGSLVEGRVERIRVLEGQSVRRGEALAFIHAHELVEAMRDVSTAESRHEYARNALERSRSLLESGAVSLEEVQRRESEAASALAELNRARTVVEHLDPSPQGDVTIRAPRAGVVLAVHTHPAQAVSPGSPLFTVGSEAVLWASVQVPERDVASLEPGGAARVRFDALPDTVVAGRVVAIGRQVHPDTRSVTVRVELERVPRGIRTGMYVSVELEEAGRFSGLEVPADAVQRVGDRDVVFVATDSLHFRPVAVTAQLARDDRMVVQGLGEGDQVVVRGAYALKAVLEQTGAEGAP